MRTLSLIVFCLFCSFASFGQPEESADVDVLAVHEAYGPVIPTLEFDDVTHQFGLIDQNTPVSKTFEFVNVGDEPLIILDAKGSCGCTATEYTKTPVMPGQTATVTATFDAKAIGPFTKTVTVVTDSQENYVLKVKGEVVFRF